MAFARVRAMAPLAFLLGIALACGCGGMPPPDSPPAPGVGAPAPAPVAPAATPSGCTKDMDCKGDRICQNAQCVPAR